MMLRKTSVIAALGLISATLLPNHDIFNFIFQGTPLVVWKQLLGSTLIALSFIYLENKKLNRGGPSRVRLLQRLLFILATFLAITSYLDGVPIERIAYGTIAYIGFAGALGFSHVCLIKNRLSETLSVFFYVGLFCSAGVIIDYFFPIFDFLPRASGVEFEEQLTHGYLRRASFFFGTSTTVYPFLSFSIAAIAITLQQDQSKRNIASFILLAVTTILAIYLTGSRANLILILAFLFLVFLITFSFLPPYKKVILATPLLFVPVLLDVVFRFIYQGGALAERYSDILSSDAAGNEHRFEVWQKGWGLFSEFGANFFVGNGIGSSLGMLNDGFPSTTHYESSFFQSFSEGGIFGLLLRYLPLIFATVFLALKKGPLSGFEKVIFSWMALYFVSVSVSPTAAAYHTQFVYFFACGIALQTALVKNFFQGHGARAANLDKGNHVKGRTSVYFTRDREKKHDA